MENSGVIPVPFGTLRSNYPMFKHLPKPIQDYMDGLNKNIPPGKPKNTPCCIQVCHALNMSGETVWPKTSQRRNAVIGGKCYIGNVKELEEYLTTRYGAGRYLRPSQDGSGDKTQEAVCAQIQGIRGVLLFRDNGYGMHTELWTGETIVQTNKSGGFNDSVMNEASIFKVPRILFWSTSDSVPLVFSSLPDWLLGWWDVNDGSQYYYYFSSDEGALYTTVKPTGSGPPPIKYQRNGGVCSMSPAGDAVKIEWSPSSQDGATTETFRGNANGMMGISNKYGGLRAVKID